MIDILNYLKIFYSFLNVLLTKLIWLTIHVTVAYDEISKLNLIKFYWRSTMPQEKLNGITILSIGNEMLENLIIKT